MTPKINWKPNSKEIRQFGVVLWVGFAVIGGLLWWKGHPEVVKPMWVTTTAIALLALLFPTAAKPFYWIWMGFGFVMGSVMSRLVTAIIYFGLMTPIAIYFRLMKRDALQRRKPNTETYWHDHPEIPKSNYPRLF